MIFRALQALDSIPINGTVKLSTIVFLSNVNPIEIYNSLNFSQSLQNKGRLTIVALGQASNSTNIIMLKNLTENIISWNLTTSLPNNWQDLFWNAYGCKPLFLSNETGS